MTSVGITLPRITFRAETGFTVTQLRAFVTSELSDAVLGSYLADALTDIERAIGPVAMRETLQARGELLLLSQPAESITGVIEDKRGAALTLSPDDFELSTSGQVLERLRTGTNPSRVWRGRVEVRYRRPDDTASRIRVAVALVELDLNYQPGLSRETIGTWQEDYAHAGLASYADQRLGLLASLDQGAEIR